MKCNICGKTNEHNFRCPYYEPPKAKHYCCICDNGIYNGERYITDENGEYVHDDCIPGIQWLTNWLGYEIKEMEDE